MWPLQRGVDASKVQQAGSSLQNIASTIPTSLEKAERWQEEFAKPTFPPKATSRPSMNPTTHKTSANPTARPYRVLCDIDRFFNWRHSQKVLNRPFTYVQVGAHTGPDAQSNDPVQEYVYNETNAYGYLIEPVPGNFEILQSKWENQTRIHTIQAAVSNVSSEVPFYYVTKPYSGCPHYWDQLGSFEKHHLEKHEVPPSHIGVLNVPILTGKQIVKDYDLAHIDMLIVDAEGFDDVIIKSFLEASTPDFIILEIHHIGRDRHRSLHKILKTRGYDCQVCAAFDVNAHCQLRGGEIHDIKIEDINFDNIQYTKN